MDLDDATSTLPCHLQRLPENLVPEYFQTISSYLRSAESEHRPSKTYLEDSQPDVSQQMRAILVDWLNEVAEEFRLKVETLCLAVYIVDRFLSLVTVQRNQLQLVGVASMLIASKMEEILPPQIDEFVYITDNTYTRDEVLRMELSILNALQYDLTVVTAKEFVGIYLKVAQASRAVCMLADYLVELTLQEYAFLNWAPSKIAASAVVLALSTSPIPCWSDTLMHFTQYQPHMLNDCLREMHRVFLNAPHSNLQAVREKYSHTRFMCISVVARLPPTPPVF
eukprot:GGOE01022587.1.p1 GENE.GGOE01022587.1~~GGOE01022587.1.p1  ORF type:complete len:281 (-),score=23.32 GGOE01022587.1:777-1619(-)